DDDNTGGTAGNGDGAIDAGETVDLMLDMINSGASASGNVTLKLRTDKAGVTITDSTAAVGIVAGSGGTQTALDAIRVSFDAAMTDESTANFELIVEEDGAPTWYDTFARVVHAPSLDLVTLRIDDSALGNGDGLIQPGEVFDLFYRLKNFGTGTANGLTAEVVDLDGAFTFTDSLDDYPDIASMDEADNNSVFRMSEADVSTEHYLEITVTDSWGRARVDTVELRRPVPPSNLKFDPSLGVDRLNVSWDDSVSTDVVRYNVYRSETQGGPYTLANTDPVSHTVYLDTGLSASFRYHYVATAIDSSGNESLPSAEGAGSTNPPQMVNFPIIMKLPTSSSPVVGDIDGDGDLEIIQGNEKIFAWHHNGLELIDGDADAHTWGILTTAGNEFVAPLALAQVDGLPGRDIIAASRDTREVYVFNYQGNVVAGWPQPVENTIRAAMSVGDLDGNGALEIIAVDVAGVIYAWNLDGSEFMDGDSNPLTPGVFYRLPGCTFQYSSPALADLDNNGTQELIVGSQSDELYVLDQSGSVWPGWPVVLSSDIAGSPAVGDIDGDGDLDLVCGNSANETNTMYRNIGGLFEGDAAWLSDPTQSTAAVALGDIDGDGDLDVVCANVSAANTLYLNSSGVVSPTSSWSAAPGVDSWCVAVGDVDGDGDLDVVFGNHGAPNTLYLNDGSTLATTPAWSSSGLFNTSRIALGDLDGDGDLDLVC
ncbi:MAG: VCBS repeat-containing protein, partial [Candidatus Krumholzibacteria bacterium]|nr:VCBS repeat-containing protein [Candidatus Krumholzibacteria bacterium]